MPHLNGQHGGEHDQRPICVVQRKAAEHAQAGDLGVDWDDVYDQRAREGKKRKDLKLPDGDTMTPDPLGDKLVTEKE